MRFITTRLILWFLICTALSRTSLAAVPKVHVIAFGKWISVQWLPDSNAASEKPITLKVRALIVDGRVKEYTVGAPHEVTDRLFVVRRAFRVNDSLPEETSAHWQWQQGGWLLIDRLTGRVSTINLPEYDVAYSTPSWYRDYAAYCGVSDDGKKIVAVVAQLSRRKPVLKKLLTADGIAEGASPESACPPPSWQRNPVRVSFERAGNAKETYAIRGHVVDLVNDAEEEEQEASK